MPKYTRFQQVTSTLAAALGDAFSQLESLGEEMREWYDNMPEGIQGSSRGDAVGEAADALENISEPEVPAALSEVQITYPTDTKAKSRRERRDDALHGVEAAIEAASTMLADELAKTDLIDQDLIDGLENFVEEAQQMIDDAEGAEFPGMMG